MTLEDIERKAKNEGRIRKTKQKINEYEISMKNDDKYSRKISKLKRKKILIKLLQYFKAVAPYAGLSLFTILITINDIRNGTRKNLVTKETIDSFGNDKTISEYVADFDKNPGTISYISKWKLNENNEYERTTKKYNLNNLKPEIVKNIVLKSDEDISLDEMFGNPMSVETEIGANLTEEEISKESYVEAIMYSEDENEFITIKYPAGKTAWRIILGILATFGLNGTYYLDRRLNNYKLSEKLSDVDEEYLDELVDLYSEFVNEDKTKRLKK